MSYYDTIYPVKIYIYKFCDLMCYREGKVYGEDMQQQWVMVYTFIAVINCAVTNAINPEVIDLYINTT